MQHTTPELNIRLVVDLAVHLQMPLVVFDFETTTFRGRPNFGIWEAAFVAALPTGAAVAYEQLMNPQAPLDPVVARLCNMTDAQLRGHPTFEHAVLPHLLEYAPKAWFGGFNIRTFDLPAAKDAARARGCPEPSFAHVFDVRQLHHEMLGTGSQKGTLGEIAASYGVAPRGSLHRAAADVALTIETFNCQLDLYGRAAVLEVMLELNAGKKRGRTAGGRVTARAVAEHARGRPRATVTDLAQHFATDPQEMSFVVGKVLDERLALPEPFGDPDVQDWLDLALPLAPREALASGKLQTVLTAIAQGAPPELDYIQLRVALMRNRVPWNTLRPD